jgi:hypothetical protein
MRKNTAASCSSLSVCLSQCNVTQIKNLLACRISCERFSGCKSREQSTAVGKTFRRAPCIQVCRLQSEQSTTQSFRLYLPYAPPPLSLSFILFSFSTSPRLSHSAVDPRLAVVHRNCQDFAWFQSLTTGHDGSVGIVTRLWAG